MNFNKSIIFCLLFIVLSSAAMGLSDTGTITAVVRVTSMFQLSLSSGTIDFQSATTGKTVDSDSELVVTSKSSGGNTWYLQISDTRPLTSGKDFISNENFSWQGETQGKGKWYGDSPSQFRTTSRVAYKSSDDEAYNIPGGTTNKFKFRLFIPEDLPAGKYTSTVMFTMTE